MPELSVEQLISSAELNRILNELAQSLILKHGNCEKLALVGIQRRGVHIAARLKTVIEKQLGKEISDGVLDINLYRDDWTSSRAMPIVGQTKFNFDINGRELVLIDDVLFTGRTIRSALEALTDFGRPLKVELLVLVDRGHRELPIQADYVGTTIDTLRTWHVDVQLSEVDGVDAIVLRKSN